MLQNLAQQFQIQFFIFYLVTVINMDESRQTIQFNCGISDQLNRVQHQLGSDDEDIQIVEDNNFNVKGILEKLSIRRKKTADSVSSDKSIEEAEVDNIVQITQWSEKLIYAANKCEKFNTLNKIKLTITSFPNLSILNLSSNYIISLQLITMLCAPNLKKIILTDNMINSIRSLRKCSFDNLNQLIIDVNQINDLDKLSQMSSKKFKIIRLDRCYWKSNTQSLSFLAKLETNILHQCCIQRRFRILTSNFEKSIKKMFPAVNFRN